MKKGSKATNETKEKLRAAWVIRKTKPISKATRIKISESQQKRFSDPKQKEKHKKSVSNPITRQKMSNSAIARCTKKWRENKSKTSKLVMSNPETKEKISKAAKERFKNAEWASQRKIKYNDENYKQKIRNMWVLNRAKILEGMIGGFWYGNVRYEDDSYCEKFNEPFKERVRAYWNYLCFGCGVPQNLLKRSLDVHHVHYDKKMCCNGSPRDVIPLCQSCHNKIRNNQDYWENYFTKLLYKYNPLGKCYFTKEEWKNI